MKAATIHERMRDEISSKAIFEQAKTYAYEYMDEVHQRTVFPDDQAVQQLESFDEPLPELPQSGEEILRQLNEIGSPATVAQTGGRYFGFVNGNVIPTALAARWLSDTWDQNAGLYVMSPAASKLEQVCQRWLIELFNLPDSTVAGLVGGTSIATFCGLAAARYTILKRLGWDVNAKGLFGAPYFRVVVSEQAHGTVFKALALLGIGRDILEIVPADSQGRLDVSQLPALDSQTLLILQAGNVNTGAFDAFEEICKQANEAEAWVHIDGAFGLWAAASRNKEQLTHGIELADSWAVDGHKTLNTPYDCGVILCRHPEALVAAMQATGSYIQLSDEYDGMLYGPDMSRRARSVELWASLKYLGRNGVEQLVDEMCARAVQFGEQLGRNGFRILNEVVFNQVLVACETAEQTEAALEHLQRSGVCWCGGTTWQGAPAIRISVCSWATTEDDVATCVHAFEVARARANT
jgi:glutamate/tyrosine decarboxylase-like PLP-dependent enzyme